MLEPYSTETLWLVVPGFIIAFVLAFGIGANDVANSFGTSVGSKVLTIFQACWLATIFEIAGAILIGYKVSDTMRKGILDVQVYNNSETELMMGSISSLSSSAVWLLVATFFKLPISGTHSIVGATVGFSLVARGTNGIHWMTLGKIVGSWFISPVLSGLTSIAIQYIIRIAILRRPDPLKAGLIALPLFYGFTVSVNIFSIVHDGPKLLYMDNIPLWMAATIALAVSVLIMLLVWTIVVPRQRERIKREMLVEKPPVNFDLGESTDTSPEGSPKRMSSNRNSAALSERQLTVITENTEMQAMMIMQKGAGDDSNHLLNNSNATNNRIAAAKYIFPIQTVDNKNGYMPAANRETEMMMGHGDINNTTSGSTTANNAASRPKELKLVESANEVNPTLSPSSSGVPLIMSKSTNRMNQNDPEACAVRLGKDNMRPEEENQSVSKLFSYLQILTAVFGSFAHGGNDVSNAIGPLITLWLIYCEGTVHQKSETPLLILLYGGLGISVGLWVWGRRVIQTVGEDLTTITPSSGFTIEIGAASTVLLASKIGIPISTTHCKVGSVVFVGYFSSDKKGVDWSLFRNIIYAWLVTVPIAAFLSAGCMFLLRYFLL